MPEWVDLAVLVLTGLFTLANWIAIWRGKLKAYYITKPLVLLGLIFYFLLQGACNPTRLPFLVGLIFSLLGDIFLIPQSTRWFMLGVGAFGMAHLSYIVGFNASLPPVPYLIIGLAAVLAGIVVMYMTIDRFAVSSEVNKKLLPFFKAYGIVVLAMAISALLCLARPGWSDQSAVLAGIGGILFFISDAMIGLEKLNRRLPKYKFWIIVTYHLGQFLIVAAVLLLPVSVF